MATREHRVHRVANFSRVELAIAVIVGHDKCGLKLLNTNAVGRRQSQRVRNPEQRAQNRILRTKASREARHQYEAIQVSRRAFEVLLHCQRGASGVNTLLRI